MEKELIQVKQENKELREKLLYYENPKNSRNSSIPPSKDENRPKRNQSLREKSENKVGGQEGHEGKTLEIKSNPDEIIKAVPKYCAECGLELTEIKEEFIERRQVVDIPPIQSICREYQIYGKECTCGHVSKGQIPKTVTSPIQYGSQTEAMISYLHSRHYIPFNRIEEIMKDVFGLPISEGGIHCLLNRFTEKARSTYNEIKQKIETSDFVGTDETGAKVNGKKQWFWVWQNEQLTYIVNSVNRGIDTIKRVFANGLPNARIQHDRWASQFHYDAKGHQICTSHLLRDLKYLIELYKSSWASKMKILIKQAIELKEQLLSIEDYQKPNIERDTLETKLIELLNFTIALSEKKSIALQKSLLKHRNSIFLFLYHLEVPPDNNGSERAIRNVKVKQKISGQFKSERGAEIYAINRSVIDTIIKSNQNILHGLNLIANFTSD
ncbi:MAG: IS66 family transposase [Nanoarchaeota archaeon]|nr:IS66 family transposase [Nanoarchaeota archaeon]